MLEQTILLAPLLTRVFRAGYQENGPETNMYMYAFLIILHQDRRVLGLELGWVSLRDPLMFQNPSTRDYCSDSIIFGKEP